MRRSLTFVPMDLHASPARPRNYITRHTSLMRDLYRRYRQGETTADLAAEIDATPKALYGAWRRLGLTSATQQETTARERVRQRMADGRQQGGAL